MEPIDTALLVSPPAQLFVEVSYVYILTSSSFVSTQAWFRQAFCCTYGTRRKCRLSPGLDMLWPFILQPATSINSSKPASFAWGLHGSAVCSRTVPAPVFCCRCQVKLCRFSAPCQPAICAQVSGTSAPHFAHDLIYLRNSDLFRQKIPPVRP